MANLEAYGDKVVGMVASQRDDLIKVVRYTRTTGGSGEVTVPAISGYRLIAMNVLGSTGWFERSYTNTNGSSVGIITSYNGTAVTGSSQVIEATYVKATPTNGV